MSAGAYADMPLVLLHLIEYLDIDYELDVAEINDRWSRTAAVDEWSQLVIKETREDVELLTSAPQTGVWRLDSAGAPRSRGAATTGTHQRRGRGVLPAGVGRRRVPLPGRGPRSAGLPLAHADGRQRADAVGARVDRGDPVAVPGGASGAGGGCPRPHDALAFKA